MRTLLVADDSVTVQRVVALTFADEPIRVITCGDGPQAIERMAAQRPDIVLAATTLPQVNGYDLALFMRGRPELKDVPVLLLSGAFETVDDVRLAVSGANGVIEKPVEPHNVIGRVKQLLGLRSEAKPETTGRLITSAEGPSDAKLAVVAPPRDVTSIFAWTSNALGEQGNPVVEVDDDWFGRDESQARAEARAPAPAAPPDSVFEIDSDWFVEDDTVRGAQSPAQQALAAEMGVTDGESPNAEPRPDARAPESAPPTVAPMIAMPLPNVPLPAIASVTPASSRSSRDVADDFAQLLAFEQGEHDEPPLVENPEARLVAPEMTDEMLDKIAARVADCLNASLFGEQLRTAMTATVRATVSEIVSATSERLVRDEIERIKSKTKT